MSQIRIIDCDVNFRATNTVVYSNAMLRNEVRFLVRFSSKARMLSFRSLLIIQLFKENFCVISHLSHILRLGSKA